MVNPPLSAWCTSPALGRLFLGLSNLSSCTFWSQGLTHYPSPRFDFSQIGLDFLYPKTRFRYGDHFFSFLLPDDKRMVWQENRYRAYSQAAIEAVLAWSAMPGICRKGDYFYPISQSKVIEIC